MKWFITKVIPCDECVEKLIEAHLGLSGEDVETCEKCRFEFEPAGEVDIVFPLENGEA